MVSVSCFGVRVSLMFHFMFVHYTFVKFGFLSGHLLIAPVPVHCFTITFTPKSRAKVCAQWRISLSPR